MTGTMRCIIWDGPGKASLQSRAVPSPETGQVLVEVLYNGICSTDYPIVAGEVAGSWPGMVIGHELVGSVAALGAGVSMVKPGDRVALDTMLACGKCRFCLDGHTEWCTHSDEIGFSVDGNYSDYAVIPEGNLHVLPDAIGSLEGTMLEALTCQLGAVDALNVGFGESAVILGSGLAALTFAQLLRLKGAGHLAVSMRPYADRVEMARKFGADQVITDGDLDKLGSEAYIRESDGFDIVIDAVGTQETALMALSLARRGGKVLLYGLSSGFINGFPLGMTIFRNLTMYGRTSAPKMWQSAIELAARKAVHLQEMIGGVVELEDVPGLLMASHHGGGPLKQVARIRGKHE